VFTNTYATDMFGCAAGITCFVFYVPRYWANLLLIYPLPMVGAAIITIFGSSVILNATLPCDAAPLHEFLILAIFMSYVFVLFHSYIWLGPCSMPLPIKPYSVQWVGPISLMTVLMMGIWYGIGMALTIAAEHDDSAIKGLGLVLGLFIGQAIPLKYSLFVYFPIPWHEGQPYSSFRQLMVFYAVHGSLSFLIWGGMGAAVTFGLGAQCQVDTPELWAWCAFEVVLFVFLLCVASAHLIGHKKAQGKMKTIDKLHKAKEFKEKEVEKQLIDMEKERQKIDQDGKEAAEQKAQGVLDKENGSDSDGDEESKDEGGPTIPGPPKGKPSSGVPPPPPKKGIPPPPPQ